jgi:uncharacterized membrane protein
MNLTTLTCAIVCSAVQCAYSADPGFYLLGYANNATSSQVNALTPHGDFAVGVSAGGPIKGFIWTEQTGRRELVDPGLFSVNSLSGVSADGGVVSGYDYRSGRIHERLVFRKVGDNPLERLPLLPGYSMTGEVTRLSADGTVVAGTCLNGLQSGLGQAFRWTPSGGTQGLGFLNPGDTMSAALGMTPDGNIIVGEAQNLLASTSSAFVWDAALGHMYALPGISGRANAVSADASTIVGTAVVADVGRRAVMWNADRELIDLGTLPGATSLVAHAVSGDGGMIVGTAAMSITLGQGFVWTPSTGMISAHEFLTARGVSVPDGYRIFTVRAISGDGSTIGGEVRGPDGQNQAFVAVVPSVASGLPLLLTIGFRRRRREHA